MSAYQQVATVEGYYLCLVAWGVTNLESGHFPQTPLYTFSYRSEGIVLMSYFPLRKDFCLPFFYKINSENEEKNNNQWTVMGIFFVIKYFDGYISLMVNVMLELKW